MLNPGDVALQRSYILETNLVWFFKRASWKLKMSVLNRLACQFKHSETDTPVALRPHVIKSFLKYIHETHPNIASMCWILEPIAESLIRHHRLRPDDNWDAISTELVRYL